MGTIREMSENSQAQREAKAKLLARAKVVGLTDSATEEEVVQAEAAKA